MNSTFSLENQFDTSLKSLSTRAQNCCKANDINDVVDLVRYLDRHSLTEIPNCGRKTILELEEFVNKYRAYRWRQLNNDRGVTVDSNDLWPTTRHSMGDYKEQASEIYYSLSEAADLPIKEAFEKLYPTPRFFFNAVLEKPEGIFIMDLSLNYAIMKGIWDLTKEILSATAYIHVFNEDGITFVERVRRTLSIIRANMDERHDEMLFKYLPDSVQGILETRFQELKSSLNQRAINVLNRENVDQFSILNFCNILLQDNTNITQCGRRTSEEIRQRFKDFRQFIIGLATTDNHKALTMSARISFPFLSDEQIETIIKHKEENGRFPFFLIIYYFFVNTENRHAKLYDKYNGITGERLNLRQIANKMNITSERVRQILRSFHPALELKHVLEDIQSIVHKESHSPLLEIDGKDQGMLHINSFLNEVCLPELATYNISLTLHGLIGIFSLLGNYEVAKYRHHYFLLPNGVMRTLKWPNTIEWIDRQIRSRSTFERKISLVSVVQDLTLYKNHDFTRLLTYLETISYRAFGLKANELHNIILPSNTVNFENELFLILQEKGKPMNMDELMDEFYARNPDYINKPRTSLKLHLFSSTRIKPIGKTGTYSLSDWNYNTLTIRELVVAILNESPVPLSAEDITKRLLEMGRSSNANSVLASIGSDNKHAYAKFHGGLIGLSNKEYGDEFVRKGRISKMRIDFTHRLKSFLQFIDTHHHLPSSAGKNEELSLYRWYNNIQNRITKLQPEEMAELEAELAVRKNFLITAREHSFSMRCESYKKYTESHGAKPTQNSCPSLYLWHRTAYRTRHKLSDHETRSFNRLSEYLTSMGLEP